MWQRAWSAVKDTSARLRPPGQCVVCRAWSAQAWCAACALRFAGSTLRCPRCAARLGVAAAACGECLHDAPPFERCHCAFDYAFPWHQLIVQFKFHGRVELAAPLARQLRDRLLDEQAERPDVIVPIPLSAQRLAQRGYNQAWEITRRLGAQLQLTTLASALQRRVDGAHQADLPLARRRGNLRGAFAVNPAHAAALTQRHVALVDDVMTSGATLREAATTLRRAGARRVDAWVLARTPPPGG